jgi:hypothetical protein
VGKPSAGHEEADVTLEDCRVSSPTFRTLQRLRQLGYVAEACERWLPRANVRRDLFHVADVIGVHAIRREVLLIQATTLSNLPARVKKVRGQVELQILLRAGLAVQCWGWFERGGKWEPRVVEIRAGDLDAVPVTPARRRQRRPQQRQLFA